jgi:hypothetical protein
MCIKGSLLGEGGWGMRPIIKEKCECTQEKRKGK